MKRAWFVLALVAACGDNLTAGEPPAPEPTSQAELLATLEDLAAFGPKNAGTPEGQQAARYVADRFRALGLSDVHQEPFTFPQWKLISKAMTLTIDGEPRDVGFDVFEASGSGAVDGDIIDVATATDADLEGVDLTGKVALVTRDPSFHRSAQYKNVERAGAAAMLYLSIAPSNLRQVGSVRLDWEAAGTIPALTIGADDGDAIREALGAGLTVHATIDVTVESTPGTGTNVIGVLPGERPERIVLGAHFDTWFAGSADNGGGVAELLAVAKRQVARGTPRYTVVFVGYDGEEIGLYGGYDYLRKHILADAVATTAVLNLESPSANEPELTGLVHSNQPALDEALKAAHLRSLYGAYAGLEIVAQLFGGIIPTDIQGAYRSGFPTVTTAVTNNYYHTPEDTPDKVDLELLALSSDAFDDALALIMAQEPSAYAMHDPEVWQAEVTTTPGDMFVVDAVIRDGEGSPGAGAKATASILYDDFLLAGTLEAPVDADGKVRFQFPPAALEMGSGNRYLHISAGPTYPLVEKLIALP